jgi:hypothetical protein
MYIKSQPYYDYKLNCYYSVLSLNKKPTNPLLSKHVIRIQNPKLSPFEEYDKASPREQCLYVIKKTLLEETDGYISSNYIDYLTFDDYPHLLDYLIDNGIQVNTEISNMLQNHISHVPYNILCYIMA